MIYTPLTQKAMLLAYDAHHGQLDKGGVPYIFHPIHLAEQMPDELTTIVALLHDVVEDTDLTLDDLAHDFPPAVIDALRLLTHTPGTNYLDYVRALRDNPIAATVKRADLLYNSDQSRLALSPTDDATRARLRQKYQKALTLLEGQDR